MASSVESFALPLPSIPPVSTESSSSSSLSGGVSQEEFNLFHSIDRRLFARLVLSLRRDPVQSMQVMALWMWLEDAAGDSFLVKKLLDLPNDILSAAADEALLCLRCVETDSFAAVASLPSADKFVPLTQSMIAGGGRATVSLHFFHANRLNALCGITQIISEVCVRAFNDILLISAAAAVEENPPAPPVQTYTYPYYPRGQRQAAGSHELGELLMSRLKLVQGEDSNSNNNEDQGLVPQDDRTIFLTFSKGYPISESEVKDFFAKKFGEWIETIHMQEVSGEDQPLYARLVVHRSAMIGEVLGGKSKAKFSINGKHVWARKYVRKHNAKTSPPKQLSPTAATPKEGSPKSGE